MHSPSRSHALCFAAFAAVALLAVLFAQPTAFATDLPTKPPVAKEPAPVFLKPGEVVSPFDAEGLDGVTRRIDFPKQTATVLVFFSSGCPHCHKMIPEWNKWFEMKPSNVAVIGIIVDKEPKGFFEMMPIRFPVLRSPSREFLETFKVARIPLTLRIQTGGKIEEVGVGELDPIRLGQIFRP
jgi:thiol-disulfide isomerase/thioredoxin